ncbi:hypothetical protein I0P70_02780 [Pontibacter sp. FD36]|nr:hypothetical protein [Pontibacter sp. FD36]MBF8962159.1 hypothetical protein [Pontibacter sp. FD36]
MLIVTLSVSPCCITDNCATEVKTEKTDSNEDEADVCSPFYSCSSCIGFTLTCFTAEPVSLSTPSHNLFTEYRQEFFHKYYHSIWQPPKLS